MKNFLSKYWKRILILIGIIFIFINVMGKCVAPHVLIEEYAKYGPTIENKGNINSSEMINQFAESSPFSEDMTRIVIVLVVGLLVACIVSELANKKSSGGKKK